MDIKIEKLKVDDTLYETTLTTKFTRRKQYVKPDPSKIIAFIPGLIRKVFIYEGKRIKKGEKLLILEAMKMENTVAAEYNAVIKKIHVSEGNVVVKNQLLIETELI